MLLELKTSHFQGGSPVPFHLISLVCNPNLAVWLLGSHLNLLSRWRKYFQIWKLAVGTLVFCTQGWVFYKERKFFGSPLAARFRWSNTCMLAMSSSVVWCHGREAEKKATVNRRHLGDLSFCFIMMRTIFFPVSGNYFMYFSLCYVFEAGSRFVSLDNL